MRVNLQPAYLLHSRPYRDSSQILELLTVEHGLLSVVGKGVKRRSHGGSTASVLQPFRPLLVSFTGRSEMKSLVAAEAAGTPVVVRGEAAFSGLYLNELLLRLLHRHDPHPQLFAHYSETLQQLGSVVQLAPALRKFELSLLQELGYALEPGRDGLSGAAVSATGWYQFVSEVGLVERTAGSDSGQPVFAGADLLAIAAGDFAGSAAATAKRLLRLALAAQLGDKPLHSRELFRQFRSSASAAGSP